MDQFQEVVFHISSKHNWITMLPLTSKDQKLLRAMFSLSCNGWTISKKWSHKRLHQKGFKRSFWDPVASEGMNYTRMSPTLTPPGTHDDGCPQMETFSALLAICAGNSPVTGEFPAQWPVTRSFDVFVDLRLNTRLSKQSWGWSFETHRAHYDVIVMTDCFHTSIR